jgi:hypothetical protein
MTAIKMDNISNSLNPLFIGTGVKKRTIVCDRISYTDFHSGFAPKHSLIHQLLSEVRSPASVIGPFPKSGISHRILRSIHTRMRGKSDFFITAENREPNFIHATYQIGFWREYGMADNSYRFPCWMWHLEWPNLIGHPIYRRYGMRLSIERLMNPIASNHSKSNLKSRVSRAACISSHMHEPRESLFQLTNEAIGCDGYGRAFGSNYLNKPKIDILMHYKFSLCPENSIGDGYITEKIPEAYHSGCIPITWCRPEVYAMTLIQTPL